MKTNNEVKQAFKNGFFATAGHLHTDGKSLVSYSTIVAQRQENGKVLMTSRFYSMTTSHHLSGVCYHYCVPFVEKPTTDEHWNNYGYLCEVALSWQRKAQRARTEENRRLYTRQAEQAQTTAEAYNADFILSII